MNLTQGFFESLPSTVEYKNTKFFVVLTYNRKKAYVSGRRVQLLEYDPEYGSSFVEIQPEEAKKKHLGRVRSIGTVENEQQLLTIFQKYFASSEIKGEKPRTIISKIRTPRKERVSKITTKFDRSSLERFCSLDSSCHVEILRNESELILKYRESTNIRERNKIFKTILFRCGVKDKSWDRIIKNYVSYNRYKFANLCDFNESDFYQEIVIALHKQVEYWFDIHQGSCFSTYAWYTINCAFHRVLQHLTTQKRKVSYLRNNVELDSQDGIWSGGISSEKINPEFLSFEKEYEYKNLFSHIMNMFQLKEVEASLELKSDLLKIIRTKSTMKNSLYALAKKYNIEIDKLFEIELTLRENLKNAMFRDIIFYMQEDVNVDETIARKYNRSKGHVIKMRRELNSLVKTRLKEISC